MNVEAEVLEEKLAQGVTVQIGASGVSMGEAFAQADSLEVEPVAAKRIRLGDVLLWRHHGNWLAHRAIWKRGGAWLMKGDGNRCCDGWVQADAIKGRVRRVRTGSVTSVASSRWAACRAWIFLALRKR